jgi:hypothetical protein
MRFLGTHSWEDWPLKQVIFIEVMWHLLTECCDTPITIIFHRQCKLPQSSDGHCRGREVVALSLSAHRVEFPRHFRDDPLCQIPSTCGIIKSKAHLIPCCDRHSDSLRSIPSTTENQYESPAWDDRRRAHCHVAERRNCHSNAIITQKQEKQTVQLNNSWVFDLLAHSRPCPSMRPKQRFSVSLPESFGQLQVHVGFLSDNILIHAVHLWPIACGDRERHRGMSRLAVYISWTVRRLTCSWIPKVIETTIEQNGLEVEVFCSFFHPLIRTPAAPIVA